ncbi:MAG: response regulator [Terriglobia bacterium]
MTNNTNNGSAEILLAEDYVVDQELLMGVMAQNGLASKVHLARDGEEALNAVFGRENGSNGRLPSGLPRLVLLDLKLPKVDGFEVLRILKTDPRTSAIPVVVISASNDPDDLCRCYREGANSYVRKPMDLNKYEEVFMRVASYWLRINEPLAAGSLWTETGTVSDVPDCYRAPGCLELQSNE